MLENTESLLEVLGNHKRKEKARVLCIGFEEESLNELDRLLTTLGTEPVGRVMSQLRQINPATYIGKGKIQEAVLEKERLKAEAVAVDVELSPNQLRNLEKELKVPILDRPGVIIEIFSAHARTREAKTQVALARFQYLLPRLAHFWTHFERQRGGTTGLRGMGEKQIEVDRRLVKRQMGILRKRLSEIEQERKVQRAGRQDILKVAIVGYTNAGKSTLLNALTHSQVRAEDKLFATLDASVRALDPNSHPPIVAIDTVGFINKLPHSLIASFRSTLEELKEANLLVHVVDASSTQAKEQLHTTEKVLEELGVGDKPRMVILNKADCLTDGLSKNSARLISPGAMLVSALDPKDATRVRDAILDHFHKKLALWEVLIPYDASKLEAQIHAHGVVEVSRHLEKGTFYRVRMEEGWAKKLALSKYRL